LKSSLWGLKNVALLFAWLLLPLLKVDY